MMKTTRPYHNMSSLIKTAVKNETLTMQRLNFL